MKCGMTNSTPRLELLPPPIRNRLEEPSGKLPLQPLSIGTIPLDFPVIQAALSGYSDLPMRVVARRLGAPYALGEVMIDRLLLDSRNRGRTRRQLAIADEEHPVGGQLMGSVPSQFAPAAMKLVEAGFDVIDINFGCPVKSAIGGCRGGYHLGQPEIALEIVDRVRNALPVNIPVTLKMRRGIDESEESRERFFRILDGAFVRGAAAITVHARTVEQKYLGPSNWDFLRDVKKHAGSKIIIGSGDLFTAEACLEMLSYTRVNAVSVARGAIGKPWIFQQVRALAAGLPLPVPDLKEQRRVMEMQCELCLQYKDAAEVHSTMRMFGIKFAQLHPHSIEVRNAFALSRDLNDWQDLVNRWYV